MFIEEVSVIVFDGETLETRRIKNDYETLRALVGCDTIQGLTGTQLGHDYGLDIYLDDNGKIGEEKPHLCGLFINDDQKVVDTLVGRLVIARHDDDGDTRSCTRYDMDVLKLHIIDRKNTNFPDVWTDGFGSFKSTSKLLVLEC